jgi:hypothetical protein
MRVAQVEHFPNDSGVHPVDEARAVRVSDVMVGVAQQQNSTD